jgi:glucose-fructose oxidoreductase
VKSKAPKQKPKQKQKRIRYAVVGAGHIAQVAVLPAFAHARRNSELVAIVSNDPVKRAKLARRYGVDLTCGYEAFEDALGGGEIDAVFICLPNHLHHECTIRAARIGVHVLCEKPMAVTSADCEDMIRACEGQGVKLMVAYRLHFEKGNLRAIETVESGKIGEPRFFQSMLTIPVARKQNIRLNARDVGGGPLYDLGLYCLNASRYLFRAEPQEVFAFAASRDERRYRDVEEMASVLLRFPGERLASFTCSVGAADTSELRIVGTEGDLRLDPAFDYAGEITHHLTVGERTKTRSFAKRDQFAAEIVYFSDCILGDETPEPSGREGLADLRVIEAIYESIRTRKPVRLAPFDREDRPDLGQEIARPPVPRKPRTVRTESPTGGS